MTVAAPVLYPVYPQAVNSRCANCWQNRPDIALTVDPIDHVVRRMCGRCRHCRATGQPVELTDEDLAEVWEWLARQHINHRAGEDTGVLDDHIDIALAVHTPAWMPPQAGWARFEALQHELLEHQKAENGEVDLASLEPEWRDAEAYANHLRGLVDDAVHKLIGRGR